MALAFDARVRLSRRRFLKLLTVGTGLGLAAACAQPTAAPPAQPTAAPPAPTTPAAPKPTTPPATTGPAVAPTAAKPAVDLKALEEAARKEGQVVVYSSFNVDEFDKVYPLFEKRYPGIKVEHVRATGEALIQRLVTEARGGRTIADVLETNGFDVYNAISVGLLEAWQAPEAAAFPASLKEAQGLWTSTRQNTDVIGYNTDLVPKGQEPKSYDDLTDPKWKGKILIEAEDYEMYAALIHGKFGGDVARATDWLKKIMANQPELHKGHTETTELLAAGQGAIFLGAYGHRIESLKKKSAPLDWVKSEGCQLLQVGGVMKGAPHPSAARLFLNWLLGPEGQQAVSDIGRIPSRPGVKLDAPLLPDGVKWYPSRPEMAKDYAQYQKVWNETLGLT